MTDVESQEKMFTAARADQTFPDPQTVARRAVVEYQRNSQPELYWNLDETEVYVVWFGFTLGNWKCLISSDEWTDTSYFEVSYNAIKDEIYLDHYKKVQNVLYKNIENELVEG